jgi:hypothetical protein
MMPARRAPNANLKRKTTMLNKGKSLTRCRVLVGTFVVDGGIHVAADDDDPFIMLSLDEAEPHIAAGYLELAPEDGAGG